MGAKARKMGKYIQPWILRVDEDHPAAGGNAKPTHALV